MFAVEVVAPRFDTMGQALANVVTIAVSVSILALAWKRRQRGVGPTGWGWFAILIHFSANGIYLPIGPVLWFITHRRAKTGLDSDLAAATN